VLIDVTKLGETLEIDFAHHSPNVEVLHNPYDALILQVDILPALALLSDDWAALLFANSG